MKRFAGYIVKSCFYYCLSQSTKQYELYNYLLPPSYQGEIRVAEHLPCIAHIRGYEYLSVPTVRRLTLLDQTHWLSSLLAVVMSACMVSFFCRRFRDKPG